MMLGRSSSLCGIFFFKCCCYVFCIFCTGLFLLILFQWLIKGFQLSCLCSSVQYTHDQTIPADAKQGFTQMVWCSFVNLYVEDTYLKSNLCWKLWMWNDFRIFNCLLYEVHASYPYKDKRKELQHCKLWFR